MTPPPENIDIHQLHQILTKLVGGVENLTSHFTRDEQKDALVSVVELRGDLERFADRLDHVYKVVLEGHADQPPLRDQVTEIKTVIKTTGLLGQRLLAIIGTLIALAALGISLWSALQSSEKYAGPSSRGASHQAAPSPSSQP